ncbi:N-fatty-acyl-amino acid synthase/hydrolase PM20D1.2-like [Biomphalaria glabrata]|uniref:N-fatty-acyl-amino acid synthase/hydrolase PM20D1.2-like n=1 Tax=Biomphalaria glabrata TaxID=6526 RepID=A0A9W3A6Y0_BIOGL|nr:N-fatty-acyl-amino acid synthase/hydrolase PM20D1.2-like [Biomphalaria glabrata]XP_055883025.1 N-fatty-acyl-amino acid synthase/hydrolase PM20D1.2-like [Biomphalaria glabrata]XP_055883026.1 N-fatty-acyl-amino acid synthase/hydrolase PM20D1.2-like [Biomphalaria glabrata]XP_055883027.1 N-fatty-acyl-amino acid synthase/hydrolase PM20D1.2-like [Biomphalaria glabrata]XP_055883028.1 N-fatty-acyl-amino acid synthase/hydrolase PM20D1.2-like [Biomphalaria glabrata]KAI8729820.1 putative carboxypeptid
MLKLVILSALSLLIAVLLCRTVYLSKRGPQVAECKSSDSDFIELTDSKLNKFQEALRFKTVSYDDIDYNKEELGKYVKFIIQNFPHLMNCTFVQWEVVNNYSLLFTVKGSDSSLKPYLLMGHLDVVPASNLKAWDAPPFSGQILNGFIYGRGAIDMKHSVMAILEAAEYLVIKGIVPKRSFYIAFGHNEELFDGSEAYKLAQEIVKQGVTELEFISDEGMPLSEGLLPGVSVPVASIGVSEKGSLLMKLSVHGEPGHSSMPPRESTIGILANAVNNLETNLHPSMLGQGVETDMLEQLVPEMNIFQRVLMANIWFFKPLLSWVMSMKPLTSATIRTVTAVTKFQAGIKNNIIPPHAEAIVNHRIHPSQTVDEVIKFDKSVIADDRVNIEVLNKMEPHPVAGYGKKDFGFQVLKTTINQIWPKALVVPAIMLGNTDTRFYLNFTKNVYRFSPTYMYPGDAARFHGINERLSIKNYEQAINFFYHLMRNADRADLVSTHEGHHDL